MSKDPSQTKWQGIPRELILKLEIEHSILDTVRKEAAEKRARLQAARARDQA